MIRLENKRRLSPKDIKNTSTELTDVGKELGVSIKNLRIGAQAIEFDLFSKDAASREKALVALENRFGKILTQRNLLEDPPPRGKEVVVNSAKELFNEQRFWECHETLEQVWRGESKGKEKDVQQGIILAASAFVHSQKDEDRVCLGMIPRALAKLESWAEGNYYSFDVAKLKQSLNEIARSRKVKYPLV